MKQNIIGSLFQLTKPPNAEGHVATSIGCGFIGQERVTFSLNNAPGMYGVILKDGDKITLTVTIQQDIAIGTVEVERKE